MAIQSFRCHDNFFHLCLDKGDIIEIKDKMAELNRRSGKSYVLSVSVGAAIAPVENFWFDDVMHIADKYMYEDKRLKPHNRI